MRYDPKQGDRKPRAREELKKLVEQLRQPNPPVEEIANHIDDIVDELLHNNTPVKEVAKTKQVRMTTEVAIAILEHLKMHPTKHHREIGLAEGVDGGRVSEFAQGHRTVEYPEGTPEWRGRTGA